jgi:hypothetical protein
MMRSMAASRPDPQARLEGTVVVLRELIENDLPALFTAIGRQPGSRRELAWPPLTRKEGHPKATYKLLKQGHSSEQTTPNRSHVAIHESLSRHHDRKFYGPT